jgi:hypothetical protein
MMPLFEVFYQPGKLFAGLPAQRGAWILPLVLNSLLAAILSKVNFPARPWGAHLFIAIFFSPMLHSVIAGMLLIFGMMTREPPKFGTMLAMVTLSFFPYWLTLTGMTVLAEPTNLSAFVNKATLPKGLDSLLTELDILSFFEIGLLSLGFSKVTRSSIFAGFAAVGGIWVLYVSVKMAASLLS